MLIVHDYLTQRGGAERVALDLVRTLPGARLLTSVYDPEGTYPELAGYDVAVLPLNRVPAFRHDARRALPFLAPAFSLARADDDVVICSSSGWAHGIRTRGTKVVYCHNPARWLYQPEEYLQGQPGWVGLGLRLLRRPLLRWDRAAALRPGTTYVANSTTVQRRIKAAYGIDAVVIPPPVSIRAGDPQEAVPGIDPGFLLTVGRARGYKNTGAVCAAMRHLPEQRLVVVGEADRAWGNVTCLAGVSDARLRWLYANAAALVAVADEDFGLTPLEANALGTPAVVLRRGGYLDSVVEGLNGVFVGDAEPASIAAGIRRALAARWDRAAIQAHVDEFRPEVFAKRLLDVVEQARTGRPALIDLREPVATPPAGLPAIDLRDLRDRAPTDPLP